MALVLYKNLGQYLSTENASVRLGSEAAYPNYSLIVNSPVITAAINKDSNKVYLSEPVVFTVKHIQVLYTLTVNSFIIFSVCISVTISSLLCASPHSSSRKRTSIRTALFGVTPNAPWRDIGLLRTADYSAPTALTPPVPAHTSPASQCLRPTWRSRYVTNLRYQY